MTTVTDTWARADGAILGSSTDTGETWLGGVTGAAVGMAIIGNELQVASGANGANVIETGVPDATVSAVYRGGASWAGGNWGTLIVCEGPAGLYRMEWGGDTMYLERDSAATNLATSGFVPQSSAYGKVVTLKAETVAGPGTKLTVLLDGVEILTYTDTSGSRRTGTRHGIGANGNPSARWGPFTLEYEGGIDPPDGPALTVWDGDSAEPVTVLGVWDGAAVQPVTVLGTWDGAAVQPIA